MCFSGNRLNLPSLDADASGFADDKTAAALR
jgi:hypothetical protein